MGKCANFVDLISLIDLIILIAGKKGLKTLGSLLLNIGITAGATILFMNNMQSIKNEEIIVNGVSFKMIWIQGGTFTMGATAELLNEADRDEKPAHRVTLSSFCIGQTEVTQELWEAVMGSNPSTYEGTKHPVDCVSWEDCQEFINKLNTLTGKNFRLPTEAEWEYAARGGNKGHGYKYSGSNNIDDVAWYVGNNNSLNTHDVASKYPNELGLYDMSGNVDELCQDWYDENYYGTSPSSNPTGPTSGDFRVVRGGWHIENCRVTWRGDVETFFSTQFMGFRLAL